MRYIIFTVPGEPQGKGRARVTRWGTYTPEKTVLYENLIKLQYQQKTTERFDDDSMLEMKITAYFGIAPSIKGKRRLLREQNIVRPTKKPDIDNIVKCVCDALNGVAYRDDTQIVKVTAEKYYSIESFVYIDIRKI